MSSKRNYVGAAPQTGILCQLCSRSTALTKAHVPPKCAGNRAEHVHRTRPYIRDEVMYQEPPRDGGLWLKTLCQPCNRLASKYDDAYGDFARRVSRVGRLRNNAVFLPVSAGGVPAVSVAPGRVARSVLHGMAALTPSLKLVHQGFLEELLRDDHVELPPSLQLRVARIEHPQCRVSSAYWMQQVLGERKNYDVLAEICFYPFLWVLRSPSSQSLGPSLVDTERWGDATDWIRYDPVVVRADLRDVLDRLPLTVHPTLRNRDEWMELLSDERSYVLEGLVKTWNP